MLKEKRENVRKLFGHCEKYEMKEIYRRYITEQTLSYNIVLKFGRKSGEQELMENLDKRIKEGCLLFPRGFVICNVELYICILFRYAVCYKVWP